MIGAAFICLMQQAGGSSFCKKCNFESDQNTRVTSSLQSIHGIIEPITAPVEKFPLILDSHTK